MNQLQTPTPSVRSSQDTLSSTRVDFYGKYKNYYIIEMGKSTVISGEIHENAKILANHMEIVDESRQEIEKGNIITWDELKKTHSDKKAK